MSRWRVTLIALAVLLAVVPLPDTWIEAAYSNGIYPWIQAALTTTSNLVPVALFDVLVAGVVMAWLFLLVRDGRQSSRRVMLTRVAVRTATLAAGLYLAFLLAWGFNYRRVPLEDQLALSYRAVTPAAAERLAGLAVAELNRLSPRLAGEIARGDGLATALASVQRDLGARRTFVAGHPKRSLLDWYFRAASVDGMTDPFFLETFTLSTLLPIEQPMVVAHEWAHLAGFADEGEANFVGWLACLRGDDAARYSAWLFLYFELTSALDADRRQEIAARLAEGPRADLQAIAARVRAHVNPLVSAVGWGLYDQYLKANGVERGRRSYTDVVRLVLGTPLGQGAIAGLDGLADDPVSVAPATALPPPAVR